MEAKLARIKAWLIPLIRAHLSRQGTSSRTPPPFIFGLSGVQGSGKSTIVDKIQSILIENGIRTAQFSLDDLYLTNRDQSSLASSCADNEFLQSRGQFGTHDVSLAKDLFRAIRLNEPGPLSVPVYDKSQQDGAGDRAPRERWRTVDLPLDCLIFEGWAIGFEAIDEAALVQQYRDLSGDSNSKLAAHAWTHVRQLNDNLREYNRTFMGVHHFDAICCLVPSNPHFVYPWRQEQERKMRQGTGGGMSELQVQRFVNRYYPSYELYSANLASGMFPRGKGYVGRQLNVILDVDRQMMEAIER